MVGINISDQDAAEAITSDVFGVANWDCTRTAVLPAPTPAQETPLSSTIVSLALQQPKVPSEHGQTAPATVDFNMPLGVAVKSSAELRNEELDALPTLINDDKWADLKEAAIQDYDFLCGSYYVRGYLTGTGAEGGTGKSLLALIEAVAMAISWDLLGVKPKGRQRVFYHNAEDPMWDTMLKVAAICQQYNIDLSELDGWLFLSSGLEEGRDLILVDSDNQLNDLGLARLEKTIVYFNIDVVILDPLQNISEGEETNEVFRRLGKALAKLAHKTNTAIHFIHHTRKLNGGEVSVDAMRGGSALIGAARHVRMLIGMTPEQGKQADVDNHRRYFAIAAGEKSNLTLSSPTNIWFEKLSIELPSGKIRPVVSGWQWPDAFDGIDTKTANKILDVITQGVDGDKDLPYSLIGKIRGVHIAVNKVIERSDGQSRAIAKKWLLGPQTYLEEIEFEGPDRKTAKGLKVVDRPGEIIDWEAM
ncbi:MAG: AAA family ATPase [Alphaproteobacteria bacterium]|nr:AAA family ATPase [Alphaproteobacteria bacterium]